ncbi:MAG TPA: hypothetical protein VN408_35665, partial [Actinoplanes sp.]|nr:hypothetical protein [Actinoplanes sp.]
MEPRFAWDEDIAVAPHRVLRIPFADNPLRPRKLSDAVVAEVAGRTVFALPGLGPDNRAVLGALDLESGALLPDRSGLRSDALSHVVLSGGLLAGLGSGDTVIVRDAATGVLVREIPRTRGRSS